MEVVSPRVGLLFPGQGSQYVGMGRDLHDLHATARELFERANESLGFDLRKICFSGPQEELRETKNTQPAILVHSLAVWEVLREEGLLVSAAAGHSVGEYAALVAAGSLSLEDGVRLVRRRGELMYESGLERPGTMAALLGLSPAEVEEVCREASASGVVCPANYNAPRQTVVSGDVQAVERAMVLAKEAGARRVQRLEVSGAFHSPLMEPAAVGLKEALAAVSLRRCRFPVFCNVDGKPRREADDVREALERQLTSPVRWVTCVEGLTDRGVDMMLEAGPGRVLSGLARRMNPELKVASVEDDTSLERWRKSARTWGRE